MCVDVLDGVGLKQKKGTSRANHQNAVALLEITKSMAKFGYKRKDILVLPFHSDSVEVIRSLFRTAAVDVTVELTLAVTDGTST
jgi:hypothetical protein